MLPQQRKMKLVRSLHTKAATWKASNRRMKRWNSSCRRSETVLICRAHCMFAVQVVFDDERSGLRQSPPKQASILMVQIESSK